MEDRRVHERTKVPHMELVIDKITGGRESFEQVVIVIEDVSEEGMCFSAQVPLTVDDLITFELPSIAADSFIHGQIKWRKELETGGFRFGLHIIN